MKFIVTDSDSHALQCIAAEADKIPEMKAVGLFSSGFAALEYARQNPVEAAVLNVRIPDIEERDLVRELRERNPGIVIVFVSEYEEDAILAWKERADYFVKKPYESENLPELLNECICYPEGRTVGSESGLLDDLTCLLMIS